MQAMASIIGLQPPSRSTYFNQFVPYIENIIQKRVDSAITTMRNSCINSKDVTFIILDNIYYQQLTIVIDGGWSHPGYWANQCSIYAIEANSGLLIGQVHVQRGINYIGSSKGNSSLIQLTR